MTLMVALHGAVFGAWLLLFAVQTTLVSSRNVATHRKLGAVGGVLAILMVGIGFKTAVELARRGFDLSGDLNSAANPFGLLAFQLGDLVTFTILIGLGIAYRRRADLHKRFMLLATVGPLMAAPLAHLMGHTPALRDKGPLILVPLVLLWSSHAVYDRLSRGRIHPVSLWGPVALFVWANLEATVIGPSAVWHRFAAWLIS
jgi:hypothetical protein